MNKKTLKRQRDLKTKLMAAISMLLVSSLMMVTSTYAWFTLSTAPEVTGITTAVGANGNLEMALLPMNADLNSLDDPNVIASAVGNSMDSATTTLAQANITWGNLVDLQDNTVYGLDKISLYPAALKTENNGEKLAVNPLERPVYGVDGRVVELKSNDVMSGIYASGSFNVGGADTYYGVRALGTASSMSPRQAEYRSTIQSASSSGSKAKNDVAGSLSSNGGVLAGLAVKKANGVASFDRAEVKALYDTILELKAALLKIESAVKSYVVAENIAPNTAEENYTSIKDNIIAKSLDEIKAADDIAKPAGFEATYEVLYGATNGVVAKVNEATTTLHNLLYTGDAENNVRTFEWGLFAGALSAIMNPDEMLLNGFTMAQVMLDSDGDGEYDNMGAIMTDVLANGIQITMAPGSGAYATIADLCGDYQALVILPEGLTVKGIPLSGQQATMKTKMTGTPHLSAINSSVAAYEAAADGSTTNAITDYYGYMIDLAFRTNAASSKLMLQTEAQNRIYSDNTENVAIMGSGSLMTFSSAAEGFTAGNVKDLMSCLRIVFFEPDTNVILAQARLDVENATVESSAVTAKMYLYDGTSLKTDAKDAAIVELEQNKAKAVSVLVYLDGTTITNADVANGMQSMVGTMNLQFASDATLTPMEYSELKQGGETATTTVQTNLTNVKIDAAAETLGIELAGAKGITRGEAKAIAVFLRGVPSGQDVYLTVGEAGTPIKATTGTYAGMTGYGIEYDGDITANMKITVSLQQNATPTTYTVTVPTGVTGAETATANEDYTFTVAEGYELATITVGDNQITNPTLTDGSYTIPASSVTGNIVITVTGPTGA